MIDVLSFKSTTHDIIEFNPVFLVIVASHIRPLAMINASFTSMLRISMKDCDHRSQPDVWGNNDRKHRIKPLNVWHLYRVRTSYIYNRCDSHNISVHMRDWLWLSVVGVGRRTESSNTNGLCPLFEEYFGIRIIGIVP